MAKEIKSPFIENKQKDPRFTETEIELLKKLDEETLKLFRCVFYQDELSPAQQEKLQGILTPDLVKVLRRFFVHDLNWEEPLFGMPNRWNLPKYDALLTAEVPVVVAGRQMAIQFLEQGVERLNELAQKQTATPRLLIFDIRMRRALPDDAKEAKTQVVAMQDAVAFLESALQAIHIYTMNPEDVQKMVDRLRKDSSR